MKPISSQAWFWTERWQKMEREADEDIKAGRVRTFASLEAFLEALQAEAEGVKYETADLEDPMSVLRQPEPIATGFNSPEGPAFAENGDLYFVNWLTSSINRLDLAGVVHEVANTGGIPAGLAFHRDGTLYCADEGERIHGVITIDPAGTFATFVDSYEGKPLNGANDLVFDRQGVLYFSDPWGSSLARPIGGFYRAFPDRRVEQIDHGLAFPNGVALNADESAVFLAETGTNLVYRYDLAPNGSVGSRTIFARLNDEPGPDGMAFDGAGNLWVAHHGAGRVDIFDPTGREVDRIVLPGAQVTNVAFGGIGDDEVAITEVASAAVYRVRVRVAGQRLFGGWRHR